MAKDGDNWMPLYIADYLADTPHLTMGAHGAYLLLIMAYWRNGPLPDDDTALRTIARATPQEWRRVRTQIANFFTTQNGVWVHRRIDREKAKAVEIIEKRRKQTEKARAARHHDTPPVTPSVTERPSPSPSPTPLEVGGGTRARDAVLACLPSNAVIVNLSRLDTWQRQGFDLDLDILPAIRDVVARQAPDWAPYSLDYFDKPIARAHQQRTKPIPEVSHELPKFLDRREPKQPDSFVAGALRAGSGGRG